jgi:hypothetical protein
MGVKERTRKLDGEKPLIYGLALSFIEATLNHDAEHEVVS